MGLLYTVPRLFEVLDLKTTELTVWNVEYWAERINILDKCERVCSIPESQAEKRSALAQSRLRLGTSLLWCQGFHYLFTSSTRVDLSTGWFCRGLRCEERRIVEKHYRRRSRGDCYSVKELLSRMLGDGD